LNNKILLSRREIHSFYVDELEGDDDYLYAVVTAVAQTLLKNKFKQKEFSEFQEKEDSKVRLGNEVVLSGTIAAVSEIYNNYLLKDGGKELLIKKYQGEVVGSVFIKELTINARRTLRKYQEKSKTRQISENVYKRLKNEVLSDGDYAIQTSANNKGGDKYGQIQLNDKIVLVRNSCNKEDIYSTPQLAVDSITLWFGTNRAIETKELKKALTRSICSNNKFIILGNFVEMINSKIGAWIVNNPIDIDSLIFEQEDKEGTELSESRIFYPNIPAENIKNFDVDEETWNFWNNLNEEKRKILFLITNKDDEVLNLTIDKKLDFTKLQKSRYYELTKQVKEEYKNALANSDKHEMLHKVRTLSLIVNKYYENIK
jgi:hypothetical protein